MPRTFARAIKSTICGAPSRRELPRSYNDNSTICGSHGRAVRHEHIASLACNVACLERRTLAATLAYSVAGLQRRLLAASLAYSVVGIQRSWLTASFTASLSSRGETQPFQNAQKTTAAGRLPVPLLRARSWPLTASSTFSDEAAQSF